MKRLEVGDKVVLNKDSYWVSVHLRDNAGIWIPLKGVLVVTNYCPYTNRVKFQGECLWLEATSFALVNNEEL